MRATRLKDLHDMFEITCEDGRSYVFPPRPTGQNQDTYVTECLGNYEINLAKIANYNSLQSERDQAIQEKDSRDADVVKLQSDVEALQNQLSGLGQIPII